MKLIISIPYTKGSFISVGGSNSDLLIAASESDLSENSSAE
jgi:hypothetical protein